MPVQLEQPTESPMMTSQENPMLTEDNRILAPGVTRDLEYRSDTEEGTLYLGNESVTIRADFKTIQRIAQHFRECYRDGYRVGLTEARRALQAMERTA